MNLTAPLREVHVNDLTSYINRLVTELFTLSGKYLDEDKISMFANALSNELPARYPYLTMADLGQIFKNAILGDFGAIKSVSLPDIFQWVRKWQGEAKNGQKTYISGLAPINTGALEAVDWSNEVWKAYQLYLSGRLAVNDFSHYLYDRMMLDNMIPMDSYLSKMDKANGDHQLARRMVVINKFELLKRDGIQEIYKQHKNA